MIGWTVFENLKSFEFVTTSTIILISIYSIRPVLESHLASLSIFGAKPNIEKKNSNFNNSVVIRLCIINANERYEQSPIFQITHFEIEQIFSSNRNDITLVIMENIWWYEGCSFASFITGKPISKYTDSFISASIFTF